MTPAQVRDIRKQFDLSQVAAGKIFGGGSRGFYKYERGECKPSAGLARLLWLAANVDGVFDALVAAVELGEFDN
jgi:DNA-binding transcriptional regulator YiaG